jgi:alpha-glucosidase (family GH31 glycosyl hydrolase)
MQAYFALSQIPLEAVWIDQESYLDPLRDFTLNNATFGDLVTFRKKLERYNQKMILSVRAGLRLENPDDSYWTNAVSRNCLIKSAINKEENFGMLVQSVQGNLTAYFDFFSPYANLLWSYGLDKLIKLAPFDGLVLSNNEITGECDGECPNGK